MRMRLKCSCNAAASLRALQVCLGGGESAVSTDLGLTSRAARAKKFPIVLVSLLFYNMHEHEKNVPAFINVAGI